MNLRLIRHAESIANVEDRWQGRVDFPLSVTGRLQADLLGSTLECEGYIPSHMYTSPLSRALETAQIISADWGPTSSVVGRSDRERCRHFLGFARN